MQTMAHVTDVITSLVPGGDRNLAHLSDAQLLANTRGLVGESKRVFAALLAHLAEVEARRLHRTRACSSLYTYCIYELRFSEDAAARRAGAAKLVKRFPVLLGAIAHGELHLTGLLMLGPHLTPENVLNVLGRAKFRTKKELTKLVRELHPLPLVPDSIEPLGLAPPPARRPTWAQFVAASAPSVRALLPGRQPRDWELDVTHRSPAPARVDPFPLSPTEERPPAPARVESSPEDPAQDQPRASAGRVVTRGSGGRSAARASASTRVESSPDAPAQDQPPAPTRAESLPETLPDLPPAPARVESSPVPTTQLASQHYQVQFSTTEEHVQLIERAKALLARDAIGKSLGELHLRAMKLLVQALEKEKFAVTQKPRARRAHAPRELAEPRSDFQPHNRHVSAATRRTVFVRDEGRCTFVDERGERCRETRRLELHHRHCFAKGGSHSASNLTLHCPAHNALAAERDFGAAHMARRREPLSHESLAAQEREARPADWSP